MLLVTAGLVVAAGYGCFGPPGLSACGQVTGYGPAILESVGHCPAATARLGAPVRFGLLGAGCGNYESGQEAGDGLAQGTLPVEGPSGRASVEYVLSKSGSTWQSSVLVLTFADGAKVDVKACTQSLEQQRGETATSQLLEKGCAAGRADLCHALSEWHRARGDSPAATAAKQRACELGLQSDCTP
jgi:hypothetical protein